MHSKDCPTRKFNKVNSTKLTQNEPKTNLALPLNKRQGVFTKTFLLVEDLSNLFKPIKVKMLLGSPRQPNVHAVISKHLGVAHTELRCN